MITRRGFMEGGAGAFLPRLSFASAQPQGRTPNTALLTDDWKARWIACPGADPFGYGVFLFRRNFNLTAPAGSFLIHVTADNRYQFFVNGQRAVWGPARGDLLHWRYETIDIARWLKPGSNILAAVVWNEGDAAAVAQISDRTEFLLQGDSSAEQEVNTGKRWKVSPCPAYRPIVTTMAQVRGYVAVGPTDDLDGTKYPWGWEQPGFDDSAWNAAVETGPGVPRDGFRSGGRKLLVARPIPLMEEKPERIPSLRVAIGVRPSPGFPLTPAAVVVPPRAQARLLLDQTYLTCAYPELTVSGGAGSVITLRYAEALWTKGSRSKGNRNEIEGKELFGFRDVFRTDGGNRRLFRPLFWRTYRYLELNVETAGEPLTIEDIRSVHTGYPWQRRAKFDSSDPELRKMLDVGWRTARLCSHETYMDCPFYEQLQYAGDTRIQCLISIYETGDARLFRNAIEQIASSRTAEGVTFSRAPSELHQYIPPFSLWWIGILHDYWMYVPDAAFVTEMLPVVRGVISFYERHQRSDGTLDRMPWWNFVDWVREWPQGTPPAGPDGLAAPVNFQLLLALQWASRMESSLGMKPLAAAYEAAAQRLAAALERKYWNAARALYSDTTEHKTASQHTNILAVLSGVAEVRARGILEKVLDEPGLAKASIYFSYYLHEAMRSAGMGDFYLERLGAWREQLKLGMTTWPEQASASTRSDCHAWSSSPNIAVFRTILGLDTAAPGFARVSVRPHLGKLERASGVVPHPKGEVAVTLEALKTGLQAEITLPRSVTGTFHWRATERPLAAGRNSFTAI
jgi:hypothetical protein